MSTVTDTLPASFATPGTSIATVTSARQPRLLTGAVVRLFVADFAAMVSFYLLLSVVPLYAVDRGNGTAGAGLSTGVLMLTAVAAELATPALAAQTSVTTPRPAPTRASATTGTSPRRRSTPT